MNSPYQSLFTPLQAGGVTLKNRIVLVAMEGTSMLEGQYGYKFNENCRQYYIDRAKNSIGLIIPGMLPVHSFAGNQDLSDAEKVMMNPVRDFLNEIHSYGAKVFFSWVPAWVAPWLQSPVCESCTTTNFWAARQSFLPEWTLSVFLRLPMRVFLMYGILKSKLLA